MNSDKFTVYRTRTDMGGDDKRIGHIHLGLHNNSCETLCGKAITVKWWISNADATSKDATCAKCKAIGDKDVKNRIEIPQRDKRNELLTASQVANLCQVAIKTIHNWTNDGKIKHFRTPGRHLRFRTGDVAEFMKNVGFPIPGGMV
jgi:excisionase family DNA binding protein